MTLVAFDVLSRVNSQRRTRLKLRARITQSVPLSFFLQALAGYPVYFCVNSFFKSVICYGMTLLMALVVRLFHVFALNCVLHHHQLEIRCPCFRSILFVLESTSSGLIVILVIHFVGFN